jgi:hypothetical protein
MPYLLQKSANFKIGAKKILILVSLSTAKNQLRDLYPSIRLQDCGLCTGNYMLTTRYVITRLFHSFFHMYVV